MIQRLAQVHDTLVKHAINGRSGPAGDEIPSRSGNDVITDFEASSAVSYILHLLAQAPAETPVSVQSRVSKKVMTPHQKELVQATWTQVVPIADVAADLFYARLFELDPALRPLFPEDMAEQKKKLMVMIGVAVRGLYDLDKLVPALQGLGRGHVAYGVKDEHYATVGAALLWTLGQGLGGAFTEEVKEAWTVVYTLIADTMKGAASSATTGSDLPARRSHAR